MMMKRSVSFSTFTDVKIVRYPPSWIYEETNVNLPLLNWQELIFHCIHNMSAIVRMIVKVILVMVLMMMIVRMRVRIAVVVAMIIMNVIISEIEPTRIA